MKITVNPINKALIAVAYMSRFNWFDISTEDTTGKTSNFCATEIITDDMGYYTFNRQFATSKYSNGKIEEVLPVDGNKFLLLSKGGTVYTVEATNKALADCNIASGNKEDPASLIDWSRSHIDEAGKAFVVLDLRKLGNITPIVSRRIQHFINVYMGGYADCYQVPRTIYFQETDNGEIYSGVYSLETEQPITKVLYDAEYLDTVYDEKDKAEKKKVRQMMKEAREKLGEVIPLF